MRKKTFIKKKFSQFELIYLYKREIAERFLKLRYNFNTNLNVKLFLKNLYNQKFLNTLNKFYISSKIKNRLKIFFFKQLFKYKLKIKSNFYNQLLLILKEKFIMNSYFILFAETIILVGTQDVILFQELMNYCFFLKNDFLTKKFTIVESNKVLTKSQNFALINFSYYFYNELNLTLYKENSLFNVVLVNLKLNFFSHFLFVYFVFFFMYYKLYYGYFKTIS